MPDRVDLLTSNRQAWDIGFQEGESHRLRGWTSENLVKVREVRFENAFFYRVDGLDRIDVGSTILLKAETLNDAQDEALALNQPEGAKFVKITDNGLVVDYLGFEL